MENEQKHLLIVEDETKLAKALAEGLGAEGYWVTTAVSGEEALFLLSRDIFNLMILDVMLPGRSGIEITKLLRDKNDKIPVLMLTARDSIDDRVIGLDTGADDYLTKPFAFAELFRLLSRCAVASK